MSSIINWEDFQKVDLRVGTIISARINEKARVSAYVIEIDCGDNYGIKTSSAQITDLYDIDELIGRQIVAVMNFEPKRIAGVKSQVLVLGCPDENKRVVLLQPDKPIGNGEKVF